MCTKAIKKIAKSVSKVFTGGDEDDSAVKKQKKELKKERKKIEKEQQVLEEERQAEEDRLQASNVADAALAQRKRLAAAKGRRSTMLTAPGLGEPNVQGKTLLGL